MNTKLHVLVLAIVLSVAMAYASGPVNSTNASVMQKIFENQTKAIKYSLYQQAMPIVADRCSNLSFYANLSLNNTIMAINKIAAQYEENCSQLSSQEQMVACYNAGVSAMEEVANEESNYLDQLNQKREENIAAILSQAVDVTNLTEKELEQIFRRDRLSRCPLARKEIRVLLPIFRSLKEQKMQILHAYQTLDQMTTCAAFYILDNAKSKDERVHAIDNKYRKMILSSEARLLNDASKQINVDIALAREKYKDVMSHKPINQKEMYFLRNTLRHLSLLKRVVDSIHRHTPLHVITYGRIAGIDSYAHYIYGRLKALPTH